MKTPSREEIERALDMFDIGLQLYLTEGVDDELDRYNAAKRTLSWMRKVVEEDHADRQP
jgi:hypothetical protein